MKTLRFVSLCLLLLFVACGCSGQKINQKVGEKPNVVSESSQQEESEETEEECDCDGFEDEEEGEEKTELEDDEKSDDDFDDFDEEFAESEESEVFDPLSGYNRFMTQVNDRLYFWVLKPVASGYRYVVPEGARRGIGRFFDNLLYPLRFVNNLLQFKIKNAGEETLRFVLNTTFGILGLWDPAKDWFDLEAHHEDFGQTLGFYGVGSGPHIVLPFLGPSNLRDLFSLYPDYQLDPIKEVEGTEEELGVRAFKSINDTSLHIGEYESLKKDAVDLYPFLRDVYEQNRKKEIEE